MRIGFDGKRAVSNMTGLRNYSRLVIESMADDYPSDEFFVYVPKMKDNPRLEKIRQIHNIEFRLPPPGGFSGSLWRTFGISNNLVADKVNLFHGLSNELPLNIRSAGIPSVVTIHDVIYRRLPECYTPIDRKIYDFKYGKSCKNATRIIAVSERTKQDIMDFYDIEPEKIDVVYQGCDDSFKKEWKREALEEVRKRLNLPPRYILQVGTIESRKNLELTVKALSAVNEDIRLVVVGRDRKGYLKRVKEIAQKNGVASRIDFIGSVAFKDLPAVNRLAEIIVYPSRYEGFGIPVLEALESERPLIGATGSCLEEAGGESSIYVNPDNPEEMAQAINAVISDPALGQKMICEGKKHASRFDNKDMARKIMQVYQKAIQTYRH